MKEPIITSSAEVMGGTPVFAGTRVPVQTLLDYLKGGESIGDFLEGFPTVAKEQVIAFLDEAEDQISVSDSRSEPLLPTESPKVRYSGLGITRSFKPSAGFKIAGPENNRSNSDPDKR